MPYRPSKSLDEALCRLETAKHIPGWPLSREYDSAIYGECYAARQHVVAVNLSGVLRHERLFRATNPLLHDPDPALRARGEGQVRLGLARQDVMRLRLLGDLVKPHIIVSDAAFGEVTALGPGVVEEQRALLASAVDDGWEIGVVPKAELIGRAGSDLRFVCSFAFSGMSGRPDGAYLQIEPPKPYEFYDDAPAAVTIARQLYLGLAEHAEPYSSSMLVLPSR